MPFGVLLALFAYGLFSCADASIKSLGGHLSIFEIGFFASTFGIVPVLLTMAWETNWREALQFRNPRLLHLRGLSGVLGSACVVYAFTHVPMAEVYSLAFLAPFFVVLLSALLLKESIPERRWPLLLLSFVGVLILVRPGFRELGLGHLAALACAFFTASNAILLRALAPREHRLSIFITVTTYTVAINGTGMLVWGFQVPSPSQLGVLALIGTLGGLGHLTFIAALKFARANQVAPAQYTQMIWAIVLGGAFYAEYVDPLGTVGIMIVVVAGLLNVLSDQAYGYYKQQFLTRSKTGSSVVTLVSPSVAARPHAALEDELHEELSTAQRGASRTNPYPPSPRVEPPGP